MNKLIVYAIWILSISSMATAGTSQFESVCKSNRGMYYDGFGCYFMDILTGQEIKTLSEACVSDGSPDVFVTPGDHCLLVFCK